MELAAGTEWTVEAAKQIESSPPVILATALRANRSMSSLESLEPGFDGKRTAAIYDWLRPIGIKIAPTMSQEQATAWLKAMVMALADLPPDIAVAATREAIRVPVNFPNEVDGVIRAKAAPMLERREIAISRLRSLYRAAVEPEGDPVTLADARSRALTHDEIGRMLPAERDMAIDRGHITRGQVETAMAEGDQRKAEIERRLEAI